MRKDYFRKYIVRATAMVLVGAMGVSTLSGCVTRNDSMDKIMDELNANSDTVQENTAQGKDAKNTTEDEEKYTYISAKEVADSAKKKHVDAQQCIFAEPVTLESRYDGFELSIDFNPKELGITNWRELCMMYSDPELQEEMFANFTYDEERQKIIIAPTKYPVGQISTSGLTDEQKAKYDNGGGKFFPSNVGEDWGNIGTMYLVLYRNFKTGEILDRPWAYVVNVEGEIKERPVLSYNVGEDGRVQFSWNPVEGASDYVLGQIKMTVDKETGAKRLTGSLYPIAMTSDTFWTSELGTSSNSIINKGFCYFTVSEDDWLNSNEDVLKSMREKYGNEGKAQTDDLYESVYVVIAMNSEGTSMISNPIALCDIADKIPYSVAYNKEEAMGLNKGERKNIGDMPIFGYVTMCDGSLHQRLIHYDVENAKVISKRFIETDDQGNFVRGYDSPTLYIPCKMDGTPYTQEYYIYDYDESNLEEDLTLLTLREEELRKKSGMIEVSSDYLEEEGAGLDNANEEMRDVMDLQVTANSAFAEYLARSMLAGTEKIDISQFNEYTSSRIVDDAWKEAYYQNPLILGVRGYKTNLSGTILKVYYDDADGLAKKQSEIQDKIKEIIPSIIKEDMTQLQKEFAINQFLCDTIEYDEEALKNAEENNYRSVDPEYYDSFTAYGALINGKCVCAGYAAAFKLLADEAGLESIVVTGKLDGSLGHAWNKVKIDDAWQVIDVTNNDSDYIANALLNLSNDASRYILMEDRDYAINSEIKKYVADEDDKEYYRVNNMFYGYDAIADQLAESIKQNGQAILRTEYDLDDETFSMIGQAVYDRLGDSVHLYGSHWMGVIYMRDKAAE